MPDTINNVETRMYKVPALERRYLHATEQLAIREHVRFNADALISLKAIIRIGALKLDVMGFAEEESRVDAAESILLCFVRGLAKAAKGQSLYKISDEMVGYAVARSAIWPFS